MVMLIFFSRQNIMGVNVKNVSLLETTIFIIMTLWGQGACFTESCGGEDVKVSLS